MRFLRRCLVGLFLVFTTLALLTAGGHRFYNAVQEKAAKDGFRPPARERQFAVNALTVDSVTLAPVLSTFGEVNARRTLELRIPQGGEIVDVSPNFEEGGAVKAGEVLVQMDQADAQAALQVANADLQEAQVELRDAERGLEIAEDDLDATRSQLVLYSGALERQQSLVARGVGAVASVETAALGEATARQAVLSKRQDLANATSRVDQGKNGVLRATINVADAQSTLNETTLTAAFDGTLAGVSAALGTVITSNEQVGTLIDPTDLEVSFRVSTQQYASLTGGIGSVPNLPVTVFLAAGGADLQAQGIISRESASVDAGQTGRLLFARLGAAPGLRSGDFVTVNVQEANLDDVALVPSTAVSANETVLSISADNRLTELSAPILRRLGDDVIVQASEIAGLRIVAERSPLLGVGIRVTVNGDPKPQRGGAGNASKKPGVDKVSEGKKEPNGDTPVANPSDEATVELTAERRAALLAFVENNQGMPESARVRMKQQLTAKAVPASVVRQLETRMEQGL